MILKRHVLLDISKIKIKTKHVLGVKEKSSRSGVAAGICDEKGLSRGSWRDVSVGPLWCQGRGQHRAKVQEKLVSVSTTADGRHLPQADMNLFQKQKMEDIPNMLEQKQTSLTQGKASRSRQECSEAQM